VEAGAVGMDHVRAGVVGTDQLVLLELPLFGTAQVAEADHVGVGATSASCWSSKLIIFYCLR
jgi:hypothetical protein